MELTQAELDSIFNGSVTLLPKCALCDQLAWRIVRDVAEEPFLDVWLCEEHGPNGAAMYTMGSLHAVRELIKRAEQAKPTDPTP